MQTASFKAGVNNKNSNISVTKFINVTRNLNNQHKLYITLISAYHILACIKQFKL